MVNALAFSTFPIRAIARTTPTMDARARDRNEEESAGMCNKAVRDLRGGVRAYIQQPVKLKAFSIKYAVTCQTSKISRCGNIARIPGSRVYPSLHPPFGNPFLSFPLPSYFEHPRPFPRFARSTTRTDEELSADRP